MFLAFLLLVISPALSEPDEQAGCRRLGDSGGAPLVALSELPLRESARCRAEAPQGLVRRWRARLLA